jgi:hypothetical protein
VNKEVQVAGRDEVLGTHTLHRDQARRTDQDLHHRRRDLARRHHDVPFARGLAPRGWVKRRITQMWDDSRCDGRFRSLNNLLGWQHAAARTNHIDASLVATCCPATTPNLHRAGTAMKGKASAAGESCEAGWSAACHGQERGSVSYGVCRVAVVRRRMRTVGGFGELPVSSYDLFSSTEPLGRAARDRMLARLSTGPTRSGRCRWVPVPH